ncbi:MAG: hypothetical protein IIC27_04495 [Chloroflexi bacterium]|nr:hypothetical protein [Chloroflexota bacterium]
MPDLDGNPDTQEMYDHWNKEKVAAASMMNQAHDLGQYGRDFKESVKVDRVAAFKTAHPDCAICQAFAGNPPA